MQAWPRFVPVNAVLLGVLAIGASLPFVADDESPLWSAPATGHAAATKLAVILLCAALLWGAAAAGTGPWQGLVQLVVSVLAVLAVVVGDELGSGGALIAMAAVLAAVTGIAAAVTGWRHRL
ncbi:MAG: hypothetical protein WC642_01680 [Nocardioides sp.]|jgi:hypothetical protein